MSSSQTPTAMLSYPDRSTRLMLVGLFQVLLGGLCALFAAMMVAVSMMGPVAQAQQGQPMNRQAMVFGLVFYLPLAVGFTWVGMGLIRARRWAWTLTVVLSWMWLVIGVIGFAAFWLVMASSSFRAVADQGKMPPGAVAGMQVFMGAFMGCFYVVLPGTLLLLCQRDSVRATCERRDPKIPWTDRAPMPVLALSLFLAFSALSMVSLMGYGVMPILGFLISGAAGKAVILLVALAQAGLAWGAYRLRPAAWWGTLAFLILATLNAVIVLATTGMMSMYEKMEMPADQLEIIRKSGMVEWMARWGPWMGLGGGIVWLGYLLYVRRYFIASGKERAA